VAKELRDELEKEPDDHDGKPEYTQVTGSTVGSFHYTSPSAYRSANGAHVLRSPIAAVRNAPVHLASFASSRNC
jgi:hypothetical protein